MLASASKMRSRWSCRFARRDPYFGGPCMTFASTADIKTLLGSAPGWRSAFKKLYVQVLIAIALGILLGAVWPSLAIDMKPLSDGFITLIRAVLPPLIFATITVGIAKMGDLRRVGAVGVRAIIYFEVVSTIALVVGLIVGNLWQPGAGLHIAPASLDEKAVAGYIFEREIADHCRFPGEDDPVEP